MIVIAVVVVGLVGLALLVLAAVLNSGQISRSEEATRTEYLAAEKEAYGS